MAHPDPNIPLQPQGKFPWPFVALITAALILLAVFYYAPRMPRVAKEAPSAQVPDQPVPGQFQLKDLKLIPAPTGGQAYVTGTIQNTSGRKVEGVAVDIVFRDPSGAIIGRETEPLEALASMDKVREAKPMSWRESPLGPTETKAFRVALNQVPANWQQQIPEMRIVHVDFAGEKELPASEPRDEGKPKE